MDVGCAETHRILKPPFLVLSLRCTREGEIINLKKYLGNSCKTSFSHIFGRQFEFSLCIEAMIPLM